MAKVRVEKATFLGQPVYYGKDVRGIVQEPKPVWGGMIFTGEMVGQILLGRKTETRRIWARDNRAPQPGQRIWVRETWAPCPGFPGLGHIVFRAGMNDRACGTTGGVICGNGCYQGPWKSPIHLRRADSRLRLRVKYVRWEGLHLITEEGARREGFISVKHFRRCWNGIHKGNPGKLWGRNPVVCVVGFLAEVVE